MKIEIELEKLIREINKAFVCVAKTGGDQSLKGIYFFTEENKLILRSTNKDLGFESQLSCKVYEQGKFLILGDVVSRLLSSLGSKKDEVVILEMQNNLLQVSVGKHNFSLKTLVLDSFPSIPSVSGVEFEYPVGDFLQGLKNVSYAVAKSEIKPEISGVFVKSDESGNLFYVATDAYRLAEKKQEDVGVGELSFIVPDKNVRELFKIFDVNSSEKVLISVSKNSLSIKQGGVYVVSRLVEGNFPNYVQIIPSAPVSFAVFLKEDLMKSIKLSAFFADKTSQISLTVSENDAVIDAANQEIGLTKEILPVSLKGEGFTVKLNLRYLEEFLQNITDTSVVLKYTAQNKALIVQGIQDASYTYLLMPSYR